MRSPLTTLCYVEKDDSYLMLHRVSKKHDVNKDKWIGIGGHFEEGESPEECSRCARAMEGDRASGFTSFRFRCNCGAFIADEMAAGIYVSVYSQMELRVEPTVCNEGKSRMGKKGRGHEAEAVGGRQDLFEADCGKALPFSL
ncbi:MAG: DNA mismatch repair protein MutT [Lachnospiraceae bacterium]